MSVSLMPTPKPWHGNRWVVISRERLHKAPLGSSGLLVEWKLFGGTSAHEADHYYTGATEEAVKARVDYPLDVAFTKAKGEKMYCEECTSHFLSWWVANKLEKYACECGIRVK